MSENESSQADSFESEDTCRPIPDEVQQALEDHRTWLKTRKPEDPPRPFPVRDLSRLNLAGVNLTKADLSHANLRNSCFAKATLQGVIFSQAEVGGADFQDANLAGADFRESRNLNNLFLSRADLTDCELPEDQRLFPGLDYVKDASSLTGNLFFSLMMACGLAMITVLTTSDAALLTESGTIALPFLGNIINVRWFYIIAPFLLSAAYIYFHLNLQNLWGALAQLPAVFSDGRRLDQKAYPWLFNWLAAACFYQLRNQRDSFHLIRKIIAVFFAWIFLPLTLLAFGGRYLYMRNPLMTWWHLLLLVVTVCFGIWFRLAAVDTLKGRMQERRGRRFLINLGLTTVFGAVLLSISYGFQEGIPVGLEEEVVKELDDPKPWPFQALKEGVPQLLDLVGFPIVLNVEEQEVSTVTGRGEGEKKTQDRKEETAARGASLKGRNLRHAKGRGVCLNRADLRQAKLPGAYLRDAELQEAKAGEAGYPEMAADLRCAVLIGAKLHKAKLCGADLFKAKLQDAKLTECNLNAAVLAEARLDKAELKRVNMQDAILRAANLQGARFEGVQGLETFQIREARGWMFAHYDEELTKRLGLSADHDSQVTKKQFPKRNFMGHDFREIDFSEFNLQKTLLVHADLCKAILRKADLRGAYLTSAKLGKADLRGADLTGVTLEKADLTAANLWGANLRGVKGLAVSELQKATNWRLAFYDDDMLKRLELPPDHNDRVQRLRLGGYAYNLSGADFTGAFLVGAEFENVNLTKANLTGAELRGVNLKNARLHGANLTHAFLGSSEAHRSDLEGAVLREAKFSKAKLRNVSLKGADLTGADFTEALLEEVDLQEANLDGAVFHNTRLKNTDLADTQGLSWLRRMWLQWTCCTVDKDKKLP